ncbi:MAG TPA: hypothetical protein VLW53_08130, partial [Candidatus Eisenbacteria bacterium]|nr:hypothetical protein [Candidatus Eisenbacteria bacterium]
MQPRADGGRRRRLLGTAGVLLVGCLLVAALGARWAGRLTIPGRGVASVSAAMPRATVQPSPSASASPNATLAQA